MTPERFRLIEELYHAARESPAALSGIDPELRREVERLLAQTGTLPKLTDVDTVRRLTVGSSLGPYRIEEFLGAGGMGEVYRATDTKLGREVAVKVLPESFAQDVELMTRFRREAQVLAALNHPRIAQVYGIEEHAFVMELVEGPTLAERIERGPIALDEALAIARQVAEALEAAHEKGIIHRDLKPGNVKITRAGAVKLLDFGLATVARGPRGMLEAPPGSSTMTMSPTQPGMILGTAAYMSPEQARGEAVDQRTDIWAFGVVLYEMLTGRNLFKGDTTSDTLALVLTKELDWKRVPVKAQRLLRRCLERDPNRRLRDIADAWMLLDEAQQAPPAKTLAAWLLAAGAVFLLAALAVSWWWRAARTSPLALQPLVRLDIDLGTDVSIGSTAGPNVVISPDGSRLMYVSHSRLFTRRLDESKATELAGTELGANPFFSPDGQWVGFFSLSKLKKVLVGGETATSLCNWVAAQGFSWGEDGYIVAGEDGVLSRIPSDGGDPVPITKFAPGEYLHRFPQVLPGSRAVIFTAFTKSAVRGSDSALGQSNVEVMTLKDGKRKTLHRGGRFGQYLASGHLVYLDGRTLFAVPFDLDRLAVRGTPVPVLEGVGAGCCGDSKIAFSAAPTGHGTVVYRNSAAQTTRVTIQWLDADGNTQPIVATPGRYGFPSLSPDGKRLAISGVSTCDVQRCSMKPLTLDGGLGPVWTPDGRYIAYMRYSTTVLGIFLTRADGAAKPRELLDTGFRLGESQGPTPLPTPWSFAPYGRRLAFFQYSLASGWDLWTLPLETDGAGLRAREPEVLLQTPSHELQPAFSPDGRWLAYISDEAGNPQVYVRAFPDNGGKWRISNTNGLNPVWSRNGRELFYRTVDGQIMVAPYTVNGDSFSADKPHAWSERRIACEGRLKNFDVPPDGKRIVALMPVEGPEGERSQNHVTMLQNFYDELRRRVPTDVR